MGRVFHNDLNCNRTVGLAIFVGNEKDDCMDHSQFQFKSRLVRGQKAGNVWERWIFVCKQLDSVC